MTTRTTTTISNNSNTKSDKLKLVEAYTSFTSRVSEKRDSVRNDLGLLSDMLNSMIIKLGGGNDIVNKFIVYWPKTSPTVEEEEVQLSKQIRTCLPSISTVFYTDCICTDHNEKKRKIDLSQSEPMATTTSSYSSVRGYSEDNPSDRRVLYSIITPEFMRQHRINTDTMKISECSDSCYFHGRTYDSEEYIPSGFIRMLYNKLKKKHIDKTTLSLSTTDIPSSPPLSLSPLSLSPLSPLSSPFLNNTPLSISSTIPLYSFHSSSYYPSSHPQHDHSINPLSSSLDSISSRKRRNSKIDSVKIRLLNSHGKDLGNYSNVCPLLLFLPFLLILYFNSF